MDDDHSVKDRRKEIISFVTWIVLLSWITIDIPIRDDPNIGGLMFIFSMPLLLLNLVIAIILIARLKRTKKFSYVMALFIQFLIWTTMLGTLYFGSFETILHRWLS
jgi:hypothetical protein